jgi:hypothetical protein
MSEQTQQLLNAINLLEARIRQLEGGKSTERQPEGLRERLERERNERKVQSDLKEYGRQTRGESSARPTNPRRSEELRKSYNELRAPAPIPSLPAKSKAAPPVEQDVFTHPFKLLTGGENVKTFRVAPGTIQDGTNGEAVSISGLDTDIGISSTKFIVIEATITDYVASGWEVKAVDYADTAEVGTSGTPPAQNKARLLIGKVTISGDEITAKQACFSSQVLTTGLLNGLVIRAFVPAPTAASAL